ncbi:phage tail protein [Maridesulfovibrio zosterae]|uniref:phage tail protein n=1 Tax=Maridesulfovibrio zosterae TaxID=82171 RepID=UPI00040E4546|nr:phage tail protein [Maridesulfovibrio zosterae]
MKLFKNFSEFLLNVSGVQPEQLEGCTDSGELEFSGKDLGNCMEIGRFRYEGVFTVVNFQGDINLLLSQIIAWLDDNDTERSNLNLPDPELVISLLENDSVKVELSVFFEEPLIVVPDVGGPIIWNGRKWAVSELDVDIATELVGMKTELAINYQPDQTSIGV